MTTEKKRKLLEKAVAKHQRFVDQSLTAKAYYRNRNDVKRGISLGEKTGLGKNPLRFADNRISHNWHNLLVNQKASYLFSYTPIFDLGNQEDNQLLQEILGDRFGKMVKDLCVEASNCGVGWLFLWMDDQDQMHLHVMESEQIIPIWSRDLDSTLDYVVRWYEDEDEDGEPMTRYELWDKEKVEFFEKRGRQGIEPSVLLGEKEEGYYHGFGRVPFFPFYNNGEKQGDLPMYKDLIDQYDKVVSGYANDLEDIQETIFVIRNYGGEDLGVFLKELKKYKAVKIDGDGNDGGIETMQIQIPVEARKEFLQMLKNQIFISGHGIYPDHENLSATSGVALKYMYSLLEIKAGLMEMEFRTGFNELIRCIWKTLGREELGVIRQTYIRNAIQNDTEQTDIGVKSQGIISQETLLKNHPWVEDPQQEQKRKDEELWKNS